MLPSVLLPQDVIGMIIDFLHDDQAALRTCSMACKSWLHPCRFHLFYEIRLTCHERLKRFVGLAAPLSYLGPYIRILRVTINSPEDAELLRFIVIHAERLRNLKEFEYSPSESSLIDQELLGALTTVSVLRIHTGKHLNRLEDFARVISSFPHIQTLALHGDEDLVETDTASVDLGEILSSTSLARLELYLQHCPRLIESVARCLQTDILPSLDTIVLGTSCRQSWVLFDCVLDARPTAWKDLTVAVTGKCGCATASGQSPHLQTPLQKSLPSCQNLRCLRLYATRTTIGPIMAVLKNVQQLNEVHITLNFRYDSLGAKQSIYEWKRMIRYLALCDSYLATSTMTVIVGMCPDTQFIEFICRVARRSGRMTVRRRSLLHMHRVQLLLKYSPP
ncbi:hypothetical protein OBBRIDRAFT_655019 [Obba rivulosa]|uniref:F-box domain-containing protein n=1 Tax=Obba rivulosa TaxID=1052685 RepID=A0A8E2ARI2_9APHY|nr:hypothetical protein OBBRIDRAFT_655019 [Obba rivulosa]